MTVLSSKVLDSDSPTVLARLDSDYAKRVVRFFEDGSFAPLASYVSIAALTVCFTCGVSLVFLSFAVAKTVFVGVLFCFLVVAGFTGAYFWVNRWVERYKASRKKARLGEILAECETVQVSTKASVLVDAVFERFSEREREAFFDEYRKLLHFRPSLEFAWVVQVYDAGCVVPVSGFISAPKRAE